MQHKLFKSVESTHGTVLRCALFPSHISTKSETSPEPVPEQGPERGLERGLERGPDVVLLLHGRTEFIEKYFEVAERLQQKGFVVVTFDWRGQGLSTRSTANSQTGHIDNFEQYFDDIQAIMSEIIEPIAPRNLFLLAHSMGGHIAMRALLEPSSPLQNSAVPLRATVLSAPMFDLPLSRPARFMARALGRVAEVLEITDRYAPRTGPYRREEQPFDGNVLTTDKARYERMHDQIAENPGLATGGPSIGWVYQALKSIERLKELAKQGETKTPVLILSSTDETVVDPRAHHAIGDLQPHVSVLPLSSCEHEPLQERDEIFERCLAESVAFFKDHTAS